MGQRRESPQSHKILVKKILIWILLMPVGKYLNTPDHPKDFQDKHTQAGCSPQRHSLHSQPSFEMCVRSCLLYTWKNEVIRNSRGLPCSLDYQKNHGFKIDIGTLSSFAYFKIILSTMVCCVISSILHWIICSRSIILNLIWSSCSYGKFLSSVSYT